MKLSVRSKVANGLVICLLVPRVAVTAAEKFNHRDEDLGAFAADDEFILSSEKSPIATIHLQADPPGDADPSGTGDPSGCAPSDGQGMLVVNTPTVPLNSPYDLVTTESDCDPSGGGIDPSGGGAYDPSACVPFGNMKLIEVSMDPPPAVDRTFYVEGTDLVGDPSDEISISPEILIFDASACIPQNVWVTGLNDNVVDGDQDYEIRLYDEDDSVVDTTPGINLDDDNYAGVEIDIVGPNSIAASSGALYIVNVNNYSADPLSKSDLVIEPSPGLAITNFAAALVSGDKFKAKGKLKSGVLTFSRFSLDAGDELLVSVEVALIGGGPGSEKIEVRFEQPDDGLQIDDSINIRPRLP